MSLVAVQALGRLAPPVLGGWRRRPPRPGFGASLGSLQDGRSVWWELLGCAACEVRPRPRADAGRGRDGSCGRILGRTRVRGPADDGRGDPDELAVDRELAVTWGKSALPVHVRAELGG